MPRFTPAAKPTLEPGRTRTVPGRAACTALRSNGTGSLSTTTTSSRSAGQSVAASAARQRSVSRGSPKCTTTTRTRVVDRSTPALMQGQPRGRRVPPSRRNRLVGSSPPSPRHRGEPRSAEGSGAKSLSVVNELWTYRGLVYNLAERDLRSRYRRSLLGWTWSLINPAATLAIYTLVFGTFLGGPASRPGTPTPRTSRSTSSPALLTWNFFSNVLSGSINSLFGMGTLLNKVYFPPETPALANVVPVVIQAFIEAFIFVVVLAILQNLYWTVLLFPLLLLVLGLFALGFGLALSVYNVLYRDVGYLVTIVLQVLFFLTPITYTARASSPRRSAASRCGESSS